MTKILNSAIVRNQLPEFIRSEYPIFVTFLEKYYEWMELSGNALNEADKLASINDVDYAADYYIEQIKKEFLPFFPEITTIDSRKFIKLVNEFYSAKGTPGSVKFLFKALYNEDIDIFYPKEDILKASDGKWVLPLALRIDTNDPNILNIEQTLLTGSQSKATALVEKVVRSVDRQLGIVYTEVYVSNVERLFITGELVSATYNNGVADITVTGKLIGALSEIKIDPLNRGLFYNGFNPDTGYAGDPLTIVGGLNPDANTPIGALAYVGATTQGSITDILTVNGGFGFRNPSDFPGSSIVDFYGGFGDGLFGTEAKADITLLDLSNYRTLNVSDKSIEIIQTTTLENVSSNILTSNIASISTYQTLNVSPIAFVTLQGSGGGYRARPDVNIYSYYNEQNPDVLVINSTNLQKGTNIIYSFTQDLTLSFQIGDVVRLFLTNRYEEIMKVTFVTTNYIQVDRVFNNDINGVSVFKVTRSDLYNLGSLGRIEIVEPGRDYEIGEYLIFTGGSGYGANAVITEVHANNGIKRADFVETIDYIKGGEGYYANRLPTVTVDTVAGSNAVIRVTEVSGDGEQLSLTTSRIGAISSIRVVSYGYDYVSAPVISLRNADVALSNVTPGLLYVSNTKIYQGASNSLTTFSAYVDDFNPDTNILRIFDYEGTLNVALPLTSDDNLVSGNVVSVVYYGDGRAKASAKFENGLIRYPGLYLNTDGQISSDKRLQDGEKYHNFSYVINTTQDYESFREPLKQIVHPIGTKTFINRLFNNDIAVTANLTNIVYIEDDLPESFNVTHSSNNIVLANNTYDLTGFVNVGDVIILRSLEKQLQGTMNVAANNIIGQNTNFINEVQEGDIIDLSTGYTESVANVVANNQLITQNTINVSSNNVTINIIYDHIGTVNFVNANTILINTNIQSTKNFVTTTVRKVK